MSERIILISDPAPKGVDGKNFVAGNGLPTIEIGNIGDTYFDIQTRNFYRKGENGAWQYIGTMPISTDIEFENVGSGAGVFKIKNINIAEFKSLIGGDNITIENLPDEIKINATIENLNGQNVGSGAAVFKAKIANNLVFKTLTEGDNITIVSENDEVRISAIVPNLNFHNLGGGAEIYKEKIGDNIYFRTLTAGSNIELQQNSNNITINALVPNNEINAQNIGGGAEVFKEKSGNDLLFRTLAAGDNINILQNTNSIEISAISEQINGQNVGTGARVFKEKSGSDLIFRKIKAGNNVTVTENTDDIEIAATSDVSNAQNVGTGEGVFRDKISGVLNFKSLKAGANISITSNDNEIEINATASGSVTGAQNVGDGAAVFKNQVAGDLIFRKIKAGANVTITENEDDVEISVTGSGGGSDGVCVLYTDDLTVNLTAADFGTHIVSTSDSKQFIMPAYDTSLNGKVFTFINIGGGNVILNANGGLFVNPFTSVYVLPSGTTTSFVVYDFGVANAFITKRNTIRSWNSQATYNSGDIVSDFGNFYMAKTDGMSNIPITDTTHWTLIGQPTPALFAIPNGENYIITTEFSASDVNTSVSKFVVIQSGHIARLSLHIILNTPKPLTPSTDFRYNYAAAIIAALGRAAFLNSEAFTLENGDVILSYPDSYSATLPLNVSLQPQTQELVATFPKADVMPNLAGANIVSLRITATVFLA